MNILVYFYYSFHPQILRYNETNNKDRALRTENHNIVKRNILQPDEEIKDNEISPNFS